MLKMFQRYALQIMAIATLLILIINSIITVISLRTQQYDTFDEKLEQVVHTMESNQIELTSIKINLNEDYLTRARAAAYIESNNPELFQDEKELARIVELLDVDEIHVIDENGIIVLSTVPEYLGLDFYEDEQTLEFISILESDDPDAFLVQEARPNAAENKMMQYVGVARKGQKGIVQVGLEPLRQLQAQERFTYAYIFSRFPTDIGETFFAVDCLENKVVAFADEGSYSYDNYSRFYNMESLEGCENGAFRTFENHTLQYVVTRQCEDVLIGVSVPVNVMFEEFWERAAITLIYLILVLLIIIFLLSFLVKKKVIKGIHDVLEKLAMIREGNLDTRVEVGGNVEFEQLSEGINSMVESIINTANRTSKIIDMSRVPFAAFEYQAGMKEVYTTSKLSQLLRLSDKEAAELVKHPGGFLETIREIMTKNTFEEDVFQLSENYYLSIYLTVRGDEYLGVVTDVSDEMQEKKDIIFENQHDQLTGLCRYKPFKEQVEQHLEHKQEDEICAVVMMDLDNFKSINDAFGHDVGDQYLIAFANVLKSLPKEHCIPARRSGDEFCMFLHGYKEKTEIEKTLNSVFDMLNKRPVPLSNEEKRVIGMSGGYIIIKNSESNVMDLLHCADLALYEAKSKGKGNFVLY